MRLETRRGYDWRAAAEGPWPAMLQALEALQRQLHDAASAPPASVPEVLHQEHGVPPDVAAEPREWYALHRRPKIEQVAPERRQVLVRFEWHDGYRRCAGSCLYACVELQWGCYVIKPSAAGTIGAAEEWLMKRAWRAWHR